MNFGALSTLLPLAVASGINLYGTILVIGISIRLGLAGNVPAGLELFASWPVLIVAGIFYTMEFLADKIQFVDNLWDALHTFIRPLGAAFLGTEMLSGSPPETRMAAALIAGSVALTSHSGKAGSRVALNLASPGENISNIAVSLAEDLSVGVLVLFALNYPTIAAVLAGVLLIAILLIAPRLIRWALFLLRALAARLSALLQPRTQPDPLPAAHASRLGDHLPTLSARCTGQGLRRLSSRSGYLSLVDESLIFTYNSWLRKQIWQLPLSRIADVQLYRRFLVDVLEIKYDGDRSPSSVRFVFLKDRGPLAQQFYHRLAGAPQTRSPSDLGWSSTAT